MYIFPKHIFFFKFDMLFANIYYYKKYILNVVNFVYIHEKIN